MKRNPNYIEKRTKTHTQQCGECFENRQLSEQYAEI